MKNTVKYLFWKGSTTISKKLLRQWLTWRGVRGADKYLIYSIFIDFLQLRVPQIVILAD